MGESVAWAVNHMNIIIYMMCGPSFACMCSCTVSGRQLPHRASHRGEGGCNARKVMYMFTSLRCSRLAGPVISPHVQPMCKFGLARFKLQLFLSQSASSTLGWYTPTPLPVTMYPHTPRSHMVSMMCRQTASQSKPVV